MLSWRKIAALDVFSEMKISPGTLCTIYKTGLVPKRWRASFGLPPPVEILVIYGTIPAGSQAIAAEFCVRCGKPYISNHPRRRKCFVCSPYRGG